MADVYLNVVAGPNGMERVLGVYSKESLAEKAAEEAKTGRRALPADRDVATLKLAMDGKTTTKDERKGKSDADSEKNAGKKGSGQAKSAKDGD